MHQVLAYLRFLWHSKNEYAVHSPFVYDLLMKCVYDKTQHPQYDLIGRFRQNLLNDQTEIEIAELGAGSRSFKDARRKVSKMARAAGSTAFRSKLLFRLANYFKPKEVLELGSSLGIGTLSLSLGNPVAHIDTVEGSVTAGYAAKALESAGIKNVMVHHARFADFITNISPDKNFDFIFFDGHHDRDATLNYFNLLKPTIRKDTVWIFDDIHWSPGMEQAWKQICLDPIVTVSIDTFRWGIVFFRSGQVKEHFVLRV